MELHILSFDLSSGGNGAAIREALGKVGRAPEPVSNGSQHLTDDQRSD
jgi:hypothetical protein